MAIREENKMPFKSEAQRRFMYSQHPELAKEFESATPKNASLPEHVKMSDGGFSSVLNLFDNKTKSAVKSDANDAAAADAVDPVVTTSSDTAKTSTSPANMAEGGTPNDDPMAGNPAVSDPGIKDASVSDFLLPYLLGKPAMEGAGAKLADEAGAIFPQKAPLMEDAIEGATTKDVVDPDKIEVYVKGIQKGAPGGSGDVKIYGVKGKPEQLKAMFGDEAPGSVPEHILQQKGLLPAPGPQIPQAAPTGYAEGGKVERSSLEHPTPNGMMARAMDKGGYPHVTFMEDQTPEGVKETTHLAKSHEEPKMAEGGTIHKAEGRDKEPAKPKDVEMSHEKKLHSIYKSMGVKGYADGGTPPPADPSSTPPSPSDPDYWDQIKAALSQVGNTLGKTLPTVPGVAEGAANAAATPGIAPAINEALGTNLPGPAPTPPPATPPVLPPAAMPAPSPVPSPAPAPAGAASGMPNLGTIFNQDTSKLTAGVNPEDRQALAQQLQNQQHGTGALIAQAVAGLGDALAAKGGKEQHSLQNIFSMEKTQRDEALANFDQARQDRLQKLQLQTTMGDNALKQAAAADAYGVDENLNKMIGAPAGTMKKDLPTYFSLMSAQVAKQEKDADLYMKAHAQAGTDVDNAVKNSSVLGIKPSAAQLQASGAKLADNYYNRAKGNVLVKPSDGGQAVWIPAQNIAKAKQMDPNLQIQP
jgi:hypothetical protein